MNKISTSLFKMQQDHLHGVNMPDRRRCDQWRRCSGAQRKKSSTLIGRQEYINRERWLKWWSSKSWRLVELKIRFSWHWVNFFVVEMMKSVFTPEPASGVAAGCRKSCSPGLKSTNRHVFWANPGLKERRRKRGGKWTDNLRNYLSTHQ